jgi:hypothetical protein
MPLEVTLTFAGTSRTAVAAGSVAIIALAILLALGLGAPARAGAAVPDAQMDCRGHVDKGKPDPVDPTLNTVSYVFACANPISGYILDLDHQAQTFETEIFAIDRLTKQVVPTDSFSCTGSLPGWSVNCIGTYGGDYRQVPGTFAVSGDVCDEPRVDPVLYVARATVDSTGKVVSQALAGPFDLGRPRGCPKSARGGLVHIPANDSTATLSPSLQSLATQPAATTKKKATKKAARKAAATTRRAA